VDLRDDLLGRGGAVHVRHDDVRAVGRERERGRAAEPA